MFKNEIVMVFLFLYVKDAMKHTVIVTMHAERTLRFDGNFSRTYITSELELRSNFPAGLHGYMKYCSLPVPFN